MLLRTLSFVFVLSATAAFAAEGERPIPSKVGDVKVFLSGAQVARTASTSIPAGSSTFVFTGLPEGVDPQSIQVTGKGGYSILSVNHRINYLTESPAKKEIEDLQAQIKKLEHDWNIENGVQQVWVNEEQLLLKNSVVGGQQSGLTAAQLMAVNDYVRERMKAMKVGWLTQEEKKQAIGKEADKLRQQLAALQAQAPRPTSEVVVEISSEVEVSASFIISYFVGNAGWVPAYDLRATGVGQPIELLMKALVTNNTGEDWSKVDLGLSSGNPTLGGVMPVMNPWTLYIYQAQRKESYRTRGARASAYDDAPSAAPIAMGEAVMLKEMEDVSASYQWASAITPRTTTVEYRIATPFSIPSDGTPHMVGVQTQRIAATYKHYVAPKLERDAFLYARTTGWEDLNLLPGEANVFFEGTFVGQSYLQLDAPKDTLEISLGRDKGVVVERVKRKSTNEKAVIGGKRTITVGWDITVRNTKGTAVDLEVRDQYPLSPQSEVEVKLEESTGATVNEETGLLTWQVHLEPKGSKKLGFAYTVKHPKDLPVVVE